jgi:hypothetical protein
MFCADWCTKPRQNQLYVPVNPTYRVDLMILLLVTVVVGLGLVDAHRVNPMGAQL